MTTTALKRTWHNVSAFGHTRDVLDLVLLAKRTGHKTERPLWIAGEVHAAVLATSAEIAELKAIVLNKAIA